MMTMTTRREFVRTAGMLAAAGLLPRMARAAQTQPATHFASKTLPGGCFVIGSLQDGGNVLAVPSELGPIMVDAKFAHTADDLSADVQSLLKVRPVLLINTHHHADHSGGNWVFSESARIIAHKNFNPRLPANLERYAQQAQAQVDDLMKAGADEAKIKTATELAAKIKTLKAENFAAKQEAPDGVTIIDHGGVTLQLHHVGNGHTDNDLIVFLPKLNILHMGDLLFHNLHPFIDRAAKANTRGWQNSVREAMKLGDDKTIVIAGHGEVTDNTALPKQIEYFEQLHTIVETGIKEGKSKETIAALKPEQFKGRGFEQLQGMALSAMYDEVSEETH